MNNVDSPQTITHVSHCYGYGGIDMALKRIFGSRIRTIAACEIEAFALYNAIAKSEAGQADVDVPFWTDIKTFPFEEFHGLVDIYSAGFPCQPFSAAGKRGATEDPRHLYPYIAEGVNRMRPRIVFLENVEGIISAKCANGESVLFYVLRDLEERGYCATWGIFSASEVGAPHQRKRVFILGVANDDCRGLCGSEICEEQPGRAEIIGASQGNTMAHHHHQGLQECGTQNIRHSTKVERAFPAIVGGCSALADSTDARCDRRTGQEQYVQRLALETARPSGCSRLELWPSRPGEPQHEWEPPRVVNNSSNGWGKGRAEHAIRSGRDAVASTGNGQIESSVGRDIDGSTYRMDYAELRSACDSRIDELRLLGNGVVPATVELAFRTLIGRLI